MHSDISKGSSDCIKNRVFRLRLVIVSAPGAYCHTFPRHFFLIIVYHKCSYSIKNRLWTIKTIENLSGTRTFRDLFLYCAPKS